MGKMKKQVGALVAVVLMLCSLLVIWGSGAFADKTATAVKVTPRTTLAADYTGIALYNYNGKTAWWRVVKGAVQPKANGIFQNEYGWWYVKNGMVDFTRTGIDQNAYGWWRVENGKVNFNYEGLAKNQYGWWYLTGGKVDFSKIGLVPNKYGNWYVKGGKVNFSYTGELDYCGTTYTLDAGKVVGGTTPADAEAVKVLDTVGWDFKKAYYWTIDNVTFSKNAVPLDGSFSAEEYAEDGFASRTGNSYTFASMVYYLGRMAGQTVHIMSGVVSDAGEDLGNHAWNEITVRQGSKIYVLDAQYEQQWRANGENLYSGYIFTYGTKGSLTYLTKTQLD